MWGNIANRLGAKDLNATLQKIGNAVAPIADDNDEGYDDDGDEEYYDDGDEEYYDDEEEYDDEYYDEQDGGEHEEGADAAGTKSPGFGLVGLLTRALDEKPAETAKQPSKDETEHYKMNDNIKDNENFHNYGEDDGGDEIGFVQEQESYLTEGNTSLFEEYPGLPTNDRPVPKTSQGQNHEHIDTFAGTPPTDSSTEISDSFNDVAEESQQNSHVTTNDYLEQKPISSTSMEELSDEGAFENNQMLRNRSMKQQQEKNATPVEIVGESPAPIHIESSLIDSLSEEPSTFPTPADDDGHINEHSENAVVDANDDEDETDRSKIADKGDTGNDDYEDEEEGDDHDDDGLDDGLEAVSGTTDGQRPAEIIQPKSLGIESIVSVVTDEPIVGAKSNEPESTATFPPDTLQRENVPDLDGLAGTRDIHDEIIDSNNKQRSASVVPDKSSRESAAHSQANALDLSAKEKGQERDDSDYNQEAPMKNDDTDKDEGNGKSNDSFAGSTHELTPRHGDGAALPDATNTRDLTHSGVATKSIPVGNDDHKEVIDPVVPTTTNTQSIDNEYANAAYQERRDIVTEELSTAQKEIAMLRQKLSDQQNSAKQMQEQMMLSFREKEARLLQATTEESKMELSRMEQNFQDEIFKMEQQFARQKNDFIKREEEYRKRLEGSEARAQQAKGELRTASKKQANELDQARKREQMASKMAEDKVAQVMAVLDDRDEEVARLKELVKSLESSMNEHAEGAEEAEQEVEELQGENDDLQEQLARMGAECETLRIQVRNLQLEKGKLDGMRMELTMLREDRERERSKSQTVVQSALSSQSKVETERDTALSEVHNLRHQLAAVTADLELATADKERIMTANGNLQSALEAFQDERRAEMELLDEQRHELESTLNLAHEATLAAAKKTHAAEMKQVQNAADSAVKNLMDEMSDMEARVAALRSENSQMRRSLDEAIHRLQTNQEDVIDRTLMKNILLDWCTMKDKRKRQEVLELMANVLHFSDAERDKVNLTHIHIDSMGARVVGALAAPLPPAKAKSFVGDNVSEKWVNFLLAETDDEP